MHRPDSRSAGGARGPRAGRQRPRRADRRARPDRDARPATHRADRAGGHRPAVGRPAGADRAQVHRFDDSHRPRPARAHHRRPADREDRGRDRHHHQSEGFGHQVHLRRHRTEELVHCRRGAKARGPRRDGPHGGGGRRRRRVGRDAVHRTVQRLRDGRVLPRPGRGCAHHLRRPYQAGVGLPPDLAAPAPPSGPRGVPGGRLLPALAAARARPPGSTRTRCSGAPAGR